MKTFIIAEAGVNHNGSLDTAKKLVDIASDAGADAVKFQTFNADKLVIASSAKAEYQIRNMGTSESQLEMLKRLELTLDAYNELFSYCENKNIIFLSTPFDEESADFLDSIGMTIFKIPSGEITNKPLIQHIAQKHKPIILSTGMSYIGEVEKAVKWINDIWDKSISKPQLTLLHCVSNYPASFEDTNLLAMKTMNATFNLPVGYSDHTFGIEVPIAAAALGAEVIEKHFTLNRHSEGPDHKASLEPDELCVMVKAIRSVEKAMGDGVKRPTKNEIEIKSIARRSLVAARDIKAGSVVASDDIAIKRPGNGILPEFRETIIGMQATRDINIDSVIRWEYFKLA